MEKATIRTIDIEDFKSFKEAIEYIDDDFIVVNTLLMDSDNSDHNHNQDMFRLGFFLIAFCIEGCIQLDVNYKTFRLEAGDVFFGLPHTVLGNAMVSPKYKVKFVGFSTRFMHQVIKVKKEIWNTGLYLYDNPVKHFDGNKDEPVFRLLRDLILLKMADEPHCYHKEVMRYLFSILLCEVMGTINKEASHLNKTDDRKESAKRIYSIFQRFAEMLAKDDGVHRTVAYYADALCYTPKHFSKVVKQACGRTPMELINEHAMEHIKHRLKYSDKSIKEIAEEFSFSNQSFFGKYVKAHLGMSPQQFRNMSDE